MRDHDKEMGTSVGDLMLPMKKIEDVKSETLTKNQTCRICATTSHLLLDDAVFIFSEEAENICLRTKIYDYLHITVNITIINF